MLRFYDENDNIMEWSEISDEAIAELRKIDFSGLKEESRNFVDRMDTNRLGKCLICGKVVKKGYQQMVVNPDFVKGQNLPMKPSGNAVCHEHTYTGKDQGDQFKLYRDKKEQREIKSEKARAKAQAHVDRCKGFEDAGHKVCKRCGGYGIISAFMHVNGGECFECGGYGFTD